MILFIIFVVIPAIALSVGTLYGIFYKDYKKKKSEKEFKKTKYIISTIIYSIILIPVYSILCFVVGGFCAMIVLSIAYDFDNNEYKLYDEREIVSIKDNNAFIVSRYSSNSEIKYYYLYRTNGAIKSKQASQDRSLIYEDVKNKNDAKLLVFRKEFNKEFWDNEMDWIYDKFGAEVRTSYSYEFYVPEGTVSQEFNIDLE